MNRPYIETDRLILTWPSYDQIEQYYLDIIGTNMFDTILWDGPGDSDELHSYWKECTSKDPNDFALDFNIAIIEKAKNTYIGGASLRPVEKNRYCIDVGYALAPKYHGQGYATETMRALVDYAFSERESERIIANIFVGNKSSLKVVEKVGFKLEGIQRRAVKKKELWLDEWLMSITRPDWKPV